MQYVKYMFLKEFYIDKNMDRLKQADISKIESAIDSLWSDDSLSRLNIIFMCRLYVFVFLFIIREVNLNES